MVRDVSQMEELPPDMRRLSRMVNEDWNEVAIDVDDEVAIAAKDSPEGATAIKDRNGYILQRVYQYRNQKIKDRRLWETF